MVRHGLARHRLPQRAEHGRAANAAAVSQGAMADVTYPTEIAMHHYLLDLENVGASSLKSVKNLPGTAHVHLFCTEKSAKLSPEALVALNSVGHTFYAIPSGPQSLDKLLLSHLGFLIG